MTGHGHAARRYASYAIDVEIRTVNNRYLKVVPKISEAVSAIELQLEGIVREFVRRGMVTLSIRVASEHASAASKICGATLRSYLEQARATLDASEVPWTLELGSVLQLPGVLENAPATDSDELLDQVATTVRAALHDLNAMRRREGDTMAAQLSQSLEEIRKLSAKIEVRAPGVLDEYRKRLETRVRVGLSEAGQHSQDFDVVREVLLFSDKCDIREELVRLGSHLDQFQHAMDASESQGRRLDFLTQELLRETNTIGSKANDADIAHAVVGIKTLIEQVRELVQNAE